LFYEELSRLLGSLVRPYFFRYQFSFIFIQL